MTEEQEIQLIEKSKKDPKFFEPIYNYYFKDVFVFVLNRVGDKEVTGDLTSQVFLNAMKNLPKYKQLGFRFSAWLLKIASNEVNYYFRKSKRMRNVTIRDQDVHYMQTSIEEDNKEGLLEALLQLLQTLESEALQLIELRFFEKKSFKEIGFILDISENNAKVKTYRLLDRLRNSMKHETI